MLRRTVAGLVAGRCDQAELPGNAAAPREDGGVTDRLDVEDQPLSYPHWPHLRLLAGEWLLHACMVRRR